MLHFKDDCNNDDNLPANNNRDLIGKDTCFDDDARVPHFDFIGEQTRRAYGIRLSIYLLDMKGTQNVLINSTNLAYTNIHTSRVECIRRSDLPRDIL